MASRKKPSRAEILRACAEAGPGDGLDPRYDRPDPDRGEAGHKTLKLCGQIARTLSDVLAGAGDPMLRGLLVASVEPARGKGRLLVTFAPSVSAEPLPPEELASRLAKAAGLFRAEVAGAIHRRKLPELVLRLLAS